MDARAVGLEAVGVTVVLDPRTSGAVRGISSVTDENGGHRIVLDPALDYRERPVDQTPCGQRALDACASVDGLEVTPGSDLTAVLYTAEPGLMRISRRLGSGGISGCAFLLRDGALTLLGHNRD